MPRISCEAAIVIARDINTLTAGFGLSMALNASPVSTGTTDAKAAFPIAPATIIKMIQPWRRACDQIHLMGLLRSEVCARCRENSTGAVVAIELDSTIPCKPIFWKEYRTRNVPHKAVF